MVKKAEKDVKDKIDPRTKRLEKLREKTNKALSSLSDMSEIYNPDHHFDMGNVMINLITGGCWKKGAPNNVSSMYIGQQDSGKSLLALLKIKSAVDSGFIVYFFETEGAISLDKMREFGINTDFVVMIPVSEYLHLIGLKFYVLDLLNSEKLKDKSIFVFDSIVMVLDSEKYDKNKKEDDTKTMGKGAQEMNDFFKAVIQKANLLHKPMDFVNRTYQNMVLEAKSPKYATEEDKEKISGGSAAQFGVSSIIKCKKDIIYSKVKVKDDVTEKDKEIKVPIMTKFTLSSSRKNRIVKPGICVYFIIDGKRGLLRYSGITPFAQQFGVLEKVKGGWKLKNDEKVYKTIYNIPDSSWLFELENGFGDIINNEFKMTQLFNNVIDENSELNLSYNDLDDEEEEETSTSKEETDIDE